ncbi:MAG: divalent-cation tolerance protein CutA [Bacteroidota bacterium]
MAYQVQVTTPTKELAQALAKVLLAQKLAACVQILGPVESHYEWEGQLEKSEEWLCLIKCTREKYPILESTISHLHPYEVPEIIAVPIEKGLKSYLDWMKK